MQVAQYTFQSPSTSRIQVGQLDPNSVKEEKSSSLPSSVINQTQVKANNFATTQVQEVKPTVTAKGIDTYV